MVMATEATVNEPEGSGSAADDGAPHAVPEVSGVLLRALADVVVQVGIAPSAVFQGDEALLATCEPTDFRVPLPTYRALLARAIALTGDPALGLRCALQASESAFDLLAPLVAHVPTLRHAIQETKQFQALAFDGVTLHLTERTGVARVCCDFPRSHEPTDQSVAEFLTAGLTRMVRGFGCSPSEFHLASFEHKRPSYYQVYAEAFEGKERFSQTFTGVEFAAHLLDRRHLHANPVLQTVVHRQAEQRLERLARPAGTLDRLRMYLLSQPAARVPTLSGAARQLGVSPRTLRRRLAEAGQTYRALTQHMQGERACILLRNPELTLQDVAGALGFTDTTAFYRAFKRWTGRTALDYRNAPQ
jgi:AraC-like DNA-binding protein